MTIVRAAKRLVRALRIQQAQLLAAQHLGLGAIAPHAPGRHSCSQRVTMAFIWEALLGSDMANATALVAGSRGSGSELRCVRTCRRAVHAMQDKWAQGVCRGAHHARACEEVRTMQERVKRCTPCKSV